jgi:MFS family permease
MRGRFSSAGAGRAALRASRRAVRAGAGQVVRAVGGPARARVVALFGATLALSGADAAMIGAVAPQLERALHIGNAEIGLLTSVALLGGAALVIPVGMLVDRFRRVPMLSASIVLWSVASLSGAFATSYGHLLASRLALGAVTATAGPAIASLTGDYFAPRERGHVYAYILAGEIAGGAAGFIVGGTLASLVSWRAAFVLLALPGFFLARALWRTVPEPLRGGQSRLAPGAADLAGLTTVADDEGDSPRTHELAHAAARRRGVAPDPRRVLAEDPQRMALVRAVRYVMQVPTNALLIVGSALGYFFFSGLQTFALLFVRGRYHIGQATAELVLVLLVAGAVLGTLAGGRLNDALLRRGFLGARIAVPAVCYLAAVVLLIPGFVATSVTPAVWFDAAGAALLSAANPALDAVRLDIMPAGLWGRAESVRTLLRSLAQAVAPLAFGGCADLVAGIAPEQAPVGTDPGVISRGGARGLEISFLIMLGALVAASVFLLRARKTYPRDVATAAASRRADAQLRNVAPDGERGSRS